MAIVGTRNPGVSYQEWESILLSKINVSEVLLIVSGGAKDIDTYAKFFATRHLIPLMEYLPDYSKYGRKATLRRNDQIVREVSTVIAFPSP
ncbi:MAG: DNA-protecting protein DprA [Paramuribaculum sp.]|nr:DNA-protecting protein DprA [Paramuribaculum sp.]